MNSFGRAVRIAASYRGTVIFSIVCALCVALLWGGNITAVYPLVAVVLQGDSPSEWIDKEIADSRDTIRGLETRLSDSDVMGGTQPPSGDKPAPEKLKLQHAAAQLKAERKALQRYLWFEPRIDAYAPDSAFETLLVVCALLLAGTLIKSAFRIAGQILVARLAHRTALEIRQDFYRRTLRLDLSSFDEQGRGDLMARFTADLNYVSAGIQTLFGMAVREPLKMIACLVGAAWVSWQLLLLTLIIAPLGFLAIRWLAKSLKRANRRALAELSGIYETLGETFAGMKVIKAFTMEPYEHNRFNQATRGFYRKSMKISRYDALSSPLTETMGIGMIVLAILAGGYLAIYRQTHLFGFLKISDRPLDAADLMLFYAFLAGVSDPARRLSSVFNSLQQAAAASERVFEMMDREPKITDPPRPQAIPDPLGDLTFANVCFAYESDLPVLQDIELRVQAGETVALVGPNGCGKTTLASLVPRFLDPATGSVALGGVDLRSFRLRELRQKIGLVTQETLLFNESVAANIRYGSPDATQAQIEAAARQAHAHQFITENLSDAYDTIVGPGGNRISGGQRQRIALARVILRNPEILILDEATSQIDVESEGLIHQVLAKFIRGRTTLIITHRPSTLALADRIVVMQQGRIQDVGTHDDLWARSDFYRRLGHVSLRESA